MNINNQYRLLPILATAILLAGCATKGDIEILKNDISSLEATIQQLTTDTKLQAEGTEAELNELRALTKATNALVIQNDQKMTKMFEQSLKK